MSEVDDVFGALMGEGEDDFEVEEQDQAEEHVQASRDDAGKEPGERGSDEEEADKSQTLKRKADTEPGDTEPGEADARPDGNDATATPKKVGKKRKPRKRARKRKDKSPRPDRDRANSPFTNHRQELARRSPREAGPNESPAPRRDQGKGRSPTRPAGRGQRDRSPARPRADRRSPPRAGRERRGRSPPGRRSGRDRSPPHREGRRERSPLRRDVRGERLQPRREASPRREGRARSPRRPRGDRSPPRRPRDRSPLHRERGRDRDRDRDRDRAYSYGLDRRDRLNALERAYPRALIDRELGRERLLRERELLVLTQTGELTARPLYDRRALSPRRGERRGYRSRSPARDRGRLDPSRSSPRRGTRSPPRRSPPRRSPPRRSPPRRRSPQHKSPARGSPRRRLPDHRKEPDAHPSTSRPDRATERQSTNHRPKPAEIADRSSSQKVPEPSPGPEDREEGEVGSDTNAPAPQRRRSPRNGDSTRPPKTNTSSAETTAVAPAPEEKTGTRFFIIKSYDRRHLEISQERGVWATQKRLQPRFNAAFDSCRRVVLIFSVNESKHFQGYATMMSKIASPTSEDQKNNVFSAKGTKWGTPFNVRWDRVFDLPFNDVLHIRNPWNENKPVKIGRDGQELPGHVGRELCALFETEALNECRKRRPPRRKHSRRIIVDDESSSMQSRRTPSGRVVRSDRARSEGARTRPGHDRTRREPGSNHDSRSNDSRNNGRQPRRVEKPSRPQQPRRRTIVD